MGTKLGDYVTGNFAVWVWVWCEKSLILIQFVFAGLNVSNSSNERKFSISRNNIICLNLG
jgi:hypothetical protein